MMMKSRANHCEFISHFISMNSYAIGHKILLLSYNLPPLLPNFSQNHK